MSKPADTRLLTFVWVFLAACFAVEGVRYAYMTFIQEDLGEAALDKISGLAFLGIPLATLCLSIYFLQRGTNLGVLASWTMASLATGLGFFFLVVGLYDIFVLWPESEKSLQPGSFFLTILGFVGYPISVLLIAYRYLNRVAPSKSSMRQALPFVICIGLHLLQFLLWWFWPFSQALRYGAASLALLFAATNFFRLKTSTDLQR